MPLIDAITAVTRRRTAAPRRLPEPRYNNPTTRDRRRRWIAAVVAFLAGPAVLATTLTLSTSAAQAVNNDGTSSFATYNMHGSDNGLTWRSEIQRLTAHNAVVALQEAGSGPPMPASMDRSNFRQIRLNPSRPSPFPGSVTQVTWPGGPSGSNRYVYFLQTDPRRVGDTGLDTWDGGQMNVAMVTDSQADEVRVLENPAYDPNPNAPNNRYRARPLLGLRFGNTWYWNTHARGEDVPGLLNQVRNFAATDGRNWVLVGDFNLNILNRSDDEARNQSLHLRADETLVRTGQPTFINGNNPSELDYAITHGLPAFTATIPRGAGSDHVPVDFARTPPPAQPPAPARVYGTVLATPSGRLLQENPDRSIAIGDARYDNNQTYRMYTTDSLTHYLRNVGTGDCVAVAPDARRDVSSRIVADTCDDPRSQWTISHLEDDPVPNDDNGGPQRWQSVAFPGLCLTPAGNSVTAAPCTQDAAQRWWDSPSSLPTNWQTTDANVRLESAFNGRLRRIGKVANTEVYTASKPPASWWIYWWLWEKQDFGWNIQRISPDDNLVRIKSLDGDLWCLGSRDEHATKTTAAVLQVCDAPRGVDGAGQRWLAESYPDGTIRFRNEANHLCLLSPDGQSGYASLYECQDIPAERWSVVKP
ncbi:endonuclease/exonuclease/phosphatase family protein [Frankia sp. Cj5]|uniref:endonuclease/exonuclease/phosphatase family protein n=1 Tax=Frankia sp. Cj5 TaxID=2880978 RepID=UPI001EF3FC96|nr:endonuclease/exonuclease/phosphatase family protein [Frankia sp. Cj5]